MPSKLTKRQREYLDFIRDFIKENQCAPRLEEIAERFYVTPPTAHKMLRVLRKEGHLYFDRDKVSGFYIRVPEKVGTDTGLVEILIVGVIDKYGEVLDFPKEHGHFPVSANNVKSNNIFALDVLQHISPLSIRGYDLIFFDEEIEPQVGDLCIIPIGDRWFIVRLRDQDVEGKFDWSPLAYDEDGVEYFNQIFKEQDVYSGPLKSEYILATAVVLRRSMPFFWRNF